MSAHQIELTTTGKTEPRVDSRLLAGHLGNKHKSLMALIDRYVDRIKEFGQLPFKKEVGGRVQGGGNAERFALLNEDQSLFVLALSRNTERVVTLKAKLIQAFAQARRAAELRQTEYLPTYHAMREAVHAVSAGASCESHIHVNCARLVNKTAGIGPGQRANASTALLSVLTVAQLLTARAFSEATDHRDGYRRAKLALQAIEGINAPLALAQQAQAATEKVAK